MLVEPLHLFEGFNRLTAQALGVLRDGGWTAKLATRRADFSERDSHMALPKLTAEERQLIEALEKSRGRPMTEQEINLALEQARALDQI